MGEIIRTKVCKGLVANPMLELAAQRALERLAEGQPHVAERVACSTPASQKIRTSRRQRRIQILTRLGRGKNRSERGSIGSHGENETDTSGELETCRGSGDESSETAECGDRLDDSACATQTAKPNSSARCFCGLIFRRHYF